MKGREIMTKQFGFTLAEVLITLGIIGVVAAMTIPTLMNSTGQAEFKTGLKKGISELNQAVTMNQALADSDFSVLTAGSTTLDGSISNMFVTRMNTLNSINGGAQTGTAGMIDNAMGTPSVTVGGANNTVIFLNDGAAIGFPNNIASCTAATHGTCKGVIDVNGIKKPNKYTSCTGGPSACSKTTIVVGDRFGIVFFNNRVMPNGNPANFLMYN